MALAERFQVWANHGHDYPNFPAAVTDTTKPNIVGERHVSDQIVCLCQHESVAAKIALALNATATDL